MLISFETSQKFKVSQQSWSIRLKVKNVDFARSICKFYVFAATLIVQAQAQGPDLFELGFERSFELGFERSFELGFERSHRYNFDRYNFDRSNLAAHVYEREHSSNNNLL